LLGFLSSLGCGSSSSTAANDMAVSGPCGSATNPILVGQPTDTFGPTNCVVAAGSTVHWTWAAAGHSVTESPGGPITPAFDSTVLNSGTFTVTIPSTLAHGTVVPYFCTMHGVVTGGVCSGMCGTLTVQ
jgi:plastocyanin